MLLTCGAYLIIDLYNDFIIPIPKLTHSFIYYLIAFYFFLNNQLSYCFLTSFEICK